MKLLDDEMLNIAIAEAEADWKYLHEIPEQAFEESKTTAYIESVCKKYPVHEIDIGLPTGKVYYLDAGCDDTVALRADIDAVPTENGPIHLCGHDAHTATLLGTLRYLCGIFDETTILDNEASSNQMIARLPYNILFIFQPGEEGTEGARAMLDHGIWHKLIEKMEALGRSSKTGEKTKPIRIFGIHNRPEVPASDVVVHEGPLMSAKTVFKIRMIGKPGHGSLPHKCIDPIVAAAAFVQGLQTIISRNVDPFEHAICTINSITSGTTASSAPESATITGFIRSFNQDVHKRMEDRLEALANGIAKAYECRSDIEIICRIPSVNNDHSMYEIARKAVSSSIGEEHIVDSEPSLATEDFAIWGSELPSFLYWVGSGTPLSDQDLLISNSDSERIECERKLTKNPPWHDKDFTMDSSYLKTAIPILCASALMRD